MKRSESLLSKEKSVLVVVDMQESFLAPIYRREEVERNVTFLMQAAKLLEVPVLATVQYANRMGGVTDSLKALLPESVEVVDKLCFSCFGQEDFARQLQATGKRQVLLVGIETHICMMQTALDLLEAGYQVHVPWDATSSRGELDASFGLQRMRAAGVSITSVESALYEWLYEAGTEAFKQMLPLVKARGEG